MQIEIITKGELETIETKLNCVLKILQGTIELGDNKIYTTQELAKKLHVSTKTLQNWREQKLIEFSQVNNKIFYTAKCLQMFLANHSVKRNH